MYFGPLAKSIFFPQNLSKNSGEGSKIHLKNSENLKKNVKNRRMRSMRYRIWGVAGSNPVEGEEFFFDKGFFDDF